MILTKKIPTKSFVLSQILILLIGLAFLGGIYYVLNVQYQTQLTDPFANGPVTTLPKTLVLTLDQPDDDNLSFDSSVVISGQTAPHKDVLIYTDTQNVVISSKSDGSFSTVLNLDVGVNNITVAVFDNNGESKNLQRTVYYSKEQI